MGVVSRNEITYMKPFFLADLGAGCGCGGGSSPRRIVDEKGDRIILADDKVYFRPRNMNITTFCTLLNVLLIFIPKTQCPNYVKSRWTGCIKI